MNQITRSNGRLYTMKENKNRFYFPEEYLEMEKHLSIRALHYVRFLLNTGARINEARNVRVEDINLDDNWIILRITKAKAKKGETKGTPRYISISSQMAKYLKTYIRKKKLSLTDTLNIPSTPACGQMLKAASKKARIQNPNDFSAHSLRKTLETWLMALNVNDMKIVKHLGHDIRTAISHYVQPDIFNAQQKLLMREIIGDLYAV